MTIAQALERAVTQLQDATDSPQLDAEVLLALSLDAKRSYLYTWPEQQLADLVIQRFQALIEQRAAGVPVAYLTGYQEFWSLPLAVSRATLVPRPETELLVELALERIPPTKPSQVLDLGTGTGAIALAIASERASAVVTAVDCSGEALQVAAANSERLGLAIELVRGDWYAPLGARRFDMIVSNPPYVGADEPELVQGGCRYEPRLALVAEESGQAALRHVVADAANHLEPGGWLLVEHGYRQGEFCRELFVAAGFADTETARDLQGHERVTLGSWPGADA